MPHLLYTYPPHQTLRCFRQPRSVPRSPAFASRPLQTRSRLPQTLLHHPVGQTTQPHLHTARIIISRYFSSGGPSPTTQIFSPSMGCLTTEIVGGTPGEQTTYTGMHPYIQTGSLIRLMFRYTSTTVYAWERACTPKGDWGV